VSNNPPVWITQVLEGVNNCDWDFIVILNLLSYLLLKTSVLKKKALSKEKEISLCEKRNYTIKF